MITITLANGDWRAIERAVREAGLRILADAGVSQEDPKHEWPRAAPRPRPHPQHHRRGARH